MSNIKTEEVTTIKREEVLATLNAIKGAFAYIVFNSRQTGEVKSGLYTLNVRKYDRTGEGMKYDPASKGLVQVCDVHAARRRRAGVLNASGKPVSDDRVLPLEGITLIRTNGVTYLVTD